MTELSKVQDRLKRRAIAYVHVFESPDGKRILEDLEYRFNGTTLKKHEGVIDPNASIAAAGCREVLLYINHMRKQNVVD